MSVEEKWFLLKTKMRQEKRAMDNLQRQYAECYCPEVFVEKIIRGKKTRVVEILFPGYLFVNFINLLSSINSVKNTSGIQSFVSFGGRNSGTGAFCIDPRAERENQTVRKSLNFQSPKKSR